MAASQVDGKKGSELWLRVLGGIAILGLVVLILQSAWKIVQLLYPSVP